VHPVDAPFEDSAFGVCQVLHHSYPTRDKFPSRSLQAGAVVVSVEAVTDALRKPGLAVSVAVSPLKTVQTPATPKN
jgi:hypothetical protein